MKTQIEWIIWNKLHKVSEITYYKFHKYTIRYK